MLNSAVFVRGLQDPPPCPSEIKRCGVGWVGDSTCHVTGLVVLDRVFRFVPAIGVACVFARWARLRPSPCMLFRLPAETRAFCVAVFGSRTRSSVEIIQSS